VRRALTIRGRGRLLGFIFFLSAYFKVLAHTVRRGGCILDLVLMLSHTSGGSLALGPVYALDRLEGASRASYTRSSRDLGVAETEETKSTSSQGSTFTIHTCGRSLNLVL